MGGSVGAGVHRNTLKIRTQCGYGWAPKNSGCLCTLIYLKVAKKNAWEKRQHSPQVEREELWMQKNSDGSYIYWIHDEFKRSGPKWKIANFEMFCYVILNFWKVIHHNILEEFKFRRVNIGVVWAFMSKAVASLRCKTHQ